LCYRAKSALFKAVQVDQTGFNILNIDFGLAATPLFRADCCSIIDSNTIYTAMTPPSQVTPKSRSMSCPAKIDRLFSTTPTEQKVHCPPAHWVNEPIYPAISILKARIDEFGGGSHTAEERVNSIYAEDSQLSFERVVQ
jgi:hypothetical protein